MRFISNNIISPVDSILIFSIENSQTNSVQIASLLLVKIGNHLVIVDKTKVGLKYWLVGSLCCIGKL